MSLHVVVGAGPVGSAVTNRLIERGDAVRVVTRSGAGPQHPSVERVAADAASGHLSALADGAAAIYNCANPAYTRWAKDWPPIAEALLVAAERSGAVLATTSNLYGYGPLDRPMREDDPLAASGTKGRVRAQMWHDAKARHDAGRIRATEVRAADFFGPGVTGSIVGDRVFPRLLARQGVRVLGDPDMPHSLTYVPDVAALLVAVAEDERAWGRPWHVPSGPAVSLREFVHAACRVADVAPVEVGSIGLGVLRAAGVFVPLLRELRETYFQFDRPFVLDSTATEQTFGVRATPLDVALKDTIGYFRGRRA
jgi:nucleoside-diphosphate-sugar epimerase